MRQYPRKVSPLAESPAGCMPTVYSRPTAARPPSTCQQSRQSMRPDGSVWLNCTQSTSQLSLTTAPKPELTAPTAISPLTSPATRSVSPARSASSTRSIATTPVTNPSGAPRSVGRSSPPDQPPQTTTTYTTADPPPPTGRARESRLARIFRGHRGVDRLGRSVLLVGSFCIRDVTTGPMSLWRGVGSAGRLVPWVVGTVVVHSADFSI